MSNDKESRVSPAHRSSAVTWALLVSLFFGGGVLLALLWLVELQPVRDGMGITENFLERFARNTVVRTQGLIFLVGAFYLLVRGFVSRKRRELLQGEIRKALAAAPQTGKRAPSERLDALVARAEADENSSLAPISFFVWALPILGFLGTVIGVSDAIGPLGLLAKGESAANVAPDILRHLRYAFDTTLAGLALVLPLMAAFVAASARARQRVADLRSTADGTPTS